MVKSSQPLNNGWANDQRRKQPLAQEHPYGCVMVTNRSVMVKVRQQIRIRKNNANFAKRGSPCSLLTTARETLSHAHRGSNSECRTTPWGGHAHVCTPPTDCASGHHPSRQQTTLGPQCFARLKARFDPRPLPRQGHRCLLNHPLPRKGWQANYNVRWHLRKQRYINPTFQLFSLVGYSTYHIR